MVPRIKVMGPITGGCHDSDYLKKPIAKRIAHFFAKRICRKIIIGNPKTHYQGCHDQNNTHVRLPLNIRQQFARLT